MNDRVRSANIMAGKVLFDIVKQTESIREREMLLADVSRLFGYENPRDFLGQEFPEGTTSLIPSCIIESDISDWEHCGYAMDGAYKAYRCKLHSAWIGTAPSDKTDEGEILCSIKAQAIYHQHQTRAKLLNDLIDGLSGN